MLTNINQNTISSFNANNDLSILTISNADGDYEFNTDLFNVQVTFKLNQTIIDSLKEPYGGELFVFPSDLRTQCIFQNQSTFNDKFENEIFSKTSSLDSYDPDANINIEKFSQYEILNKYYKSLQDVSYVTATGKSIVDTVVMDFSPASATGEGLGYFDSSTYEYTHVISNQISKIFLSEDYNSVRVLILDEDDNIIGDSGTQITSKSVLELASQQITVDEMLFLKENFVDGFENKLSLLIETIGAGNSFKLIHNSPADFLGLNSIFNIQIQGTISYIHELSDDNKFSFILSYIDDNFMSMSNITLDSISGWEISFNDVNIQEFNKFIVQHLFLSNNDKINFEISGTINFARKEEQSGTQRQDNLTWSFLKEVDVTNELRDVITDDENLTSAALNNIFSSLELSHNIFKIEAVDRFEFTVDNINNIDTLPLSEFSNRTILESITIDDARDAGNISIALNDENGFALSAVGFDSLPEANVLTLEEIGSRENLYFSQATSNILSSTSFINTIVFTYTHFYNDSRYSLTYQIENAEDISNTYLDRINNYNKLFENFILEFKNLILVAKEVNNKQIGEGSILEYLDSTNTSQKSLGQLSSSEDDVKIIESTSNIIINAFDVKKAYISKQNIEIITRDYEYLGYNSVDDLYDNIYIALRPKNNLYIEKFSECFELVNNNYELKSNKLRRLNLPVQNYLFQASLKKLNITEMLLSDDMQDVKLGLEVLERAVYNLKINVFVFPRVINDILDKGYIENSDGTIELFSGVGDDDERTTATQNAHNFINIVTSNNPENFKFKQLFDNDETRNSKINYFQFISSLLRSVFNSNIPTINFSFSGRQGSSNVILSQITSKEQFVNSDLRSLSNISSNESDVNVSNSIAVIDINSERNFLDETDRPDQDLLINVDNIRRDTVPEYNVYRNFYDLSNINTEVTIENNPYKINFDKYVDIGNKSSEIKTCKVDDVIIYNEASSESKIKINITNLKRSFGIFGNISQNDIFIRASLFPLFANPNESLSHYNEDYLISANNNNHNVHSWYCKQYKVDGSIPNQDWPNDEDFRGNTNNSPVTSSLSFYEGKKYFSYQRFYAKDHSGEATSRKFGFVENYIPQNYIMQERRLGNDYLVIDVNSNSVNLLDSLDFDDLTNDVISVFSKDQCMLKDVILRVSVSVKVYGGSVPKYITLYLNSPVARQNLISDKIIFNNAATNYSDSQGTSAVPLTEIKTRHIRKDY